MCNDLSPVLLQKGHRFKKEEEEEEKIYGHMKVQEKKMYIYCHVLMFSK
jgi:hypothetical protein